MGVNLDLLVQCLSMAEIYCFFDISDDGSCQLCDFLICYVSK